MCEFLLYIHVIHIIFQVLSHYRLLQDTEYICICPVLYSRSLLVISFIYSCVQIPNISHPPSPLLAVFVSVSLVYFCFVNTFICIIFLDSVHKWYMIFVLLWFTSFSMKSLGLSMLLQMALFHSFLWLSNILLYVSHTISSLSIHLSMDMWVASMSWLLLGVLL